MSSNPIVFDLNNMVGDLIKVGGGSWMPRYSFKRVRDLGGASWERERPRWVIPADAELDNPEWYERNKVVFDTEKIKGVHVWIERHASWSGTLVSNALFEAFTAANLWEFRGQYCEEA